jgi:predicted RNA-binding protein with PIN domain
MRWLVDGYNVIRQDPDLRGAEAAGLEAGRRALLAVIAAAARRTGDRFTVVFDGAPGSRPAAAPGQVEIVFSRPPETADDVLRRLARQAGRGAAVVTSDRSVQAGARRAGCAAVSAERFLAALRAPEDLEDEGEEDAGRPAPGRGNPRRASRDERAVEQALRRLRRSDR